MADIKISQMGQVTVAPTDLVPIVRDGVNYATPAGGLAVLAGSLTFTGDVTGSGTSPFAMTLANSGVTAGTYTKVTVDAKGRVTVGASLASGDLPTYTGTLSSGQVTTALGFTPASTVSPAFSGTPTSPTATAGTNTTQIATTAFVATALGSYAPLASPTFTGKVTTAASATGSAGLSVPHGAAPTSPVNGDFWSTTAGFYGRVNGVTVGPFGAGGGGSPITSSSAQAFAVGQNGNTNPAFNVDASTASSVTGVTVKSAAAGGGVNVTATSSGTNESLTINPKGAAILALGTGAGTYAVNIGAGSGCYVQTYNLYATNQNGVDHPLRFAQSSLIASPSAGGFEFGSDYCFYATPDAGNRGVIDVKTLTIQQAGYTLTSTTSAQKAFNGSTNGAVTLAVGTYEIEALIVLTGMSSTSGSFGFAMGGSATFTQQWTAFASKNAAGVNGTGGLSFSTAANTALTPSNTNTAGFMKITGTIVVTVAGTVIPQVSLGVAAAASVNTGSFFKVRKIGSTSVATVGNWS